MKGYSLKCLKISRTIALYFSFFSLGLCTAVPGPTLLDLAQIVNTGTDKIAFIYLARSSGYLAGSFIGGILFDCMKRKQLLLALCNLFMSVCALATPWSRNIETLTSILAVGGLSMGALDTGANVLCLDIWGKDSALYFQALHFVYGIGAFLAPLIAKPFLSSECFPTINTTIPTSLNDSIELLPVFQNISEADNISSLTCSSSSIPPVTHAYTIIGSYALFVTLLFVIMCTAFPYEKSQKKKEEEEQDKNGYEDPLSRGAGFTAGVAFIAQVLLSMYCGIEIGYGQMVATFSVKGDLKLSKSSASFLTSMYWGSFTFSRGISVFLSYKFSAFSLVTGDIVLMLIGSSILLVYGNVYVECLWSGTVVLALGLASFYPSVISWVERHIKVSNKVASFFVVSGCLGEMIVPLTVSQYIDDRPHMLSHIIFGCTAAVCFLSFVLWVIMSRKGEKYAKPNEQHAAEDAEISL